MTSGFEGEAATWFFQVTLPIMVTMIAAAGISINSGHRRDRNRRIDGLTCSTENRLGRIEDRLLAIETRLTAVERKVDALELKAWR
jgi:hypothetical protein